jgi:hypothetical protein
VLRFKRRERGRRLLHSLAPVDRNDSSSSCSAPTAPDAPLEVEYLGNGGKADTKDVFLTLAGSAE